MYSVRAQVLNVFTSPASEKYPESFKVQLLGDMAMKDGQVKKDMLTLSVPQDVFNSLSGRIGDEVTLPIGFFVSNNRLTPFFPKSAKIKGQKVGENSSSKPA